MPQVKIDLSNEEQSFRVYHRIYAICRTEWDTSYIFCHCYQANKLAGYYFPKTSL